MSFGVRGILILLLWSAAAYGRGERIRRPAAAPETQPSPRLLVGMNFSYGAADPSKPGATRNALSLLAAVDLPMNAHWSLAPGLSFMGRGVQTSVLSTQSFDLKGDVQLDYLEANLLMRQKTQVSRTTLATFFFGPALAVAIKRKVELLGAVDWDLSSRFTSSDALLHLGVGIESRISRTQSLIGEIRYTLGLGDIDRTPNQYRTRGILLLLGLAF